MKGLRFLLEGLEEDYEKYGINNRNRKNYKALVEGCRIRKNDFLFRNCLSGIHVHVGDVTHRGKDHWFADLKDGKYETW